MNKKIIYTLIFIALVVLAGFLRETFFIRIKWCEAVVSGKAVAPTSHWLFSFLESMNLRQLQFTKFFGTIFFVIIFWLLTLLMLYWFFNLKVHAKLVHLIFLFPFCFGIFIYACSLFLPGQEYFYAIARWSIGLIETPLIIMILFPLFWINLKTNSNL